MSLMRHSKVVGMEKEGWREGWSEGKWDGHGWDGDGHLMGLASRKCLTWSTLRDVVVWSI